MKEIPKIVIYKTIKWISDLPLAERGLHTSNELLESKPIEISIDTTAQELKKILKDNDITYFTHCSRLGDEVEIPLYPVGYVSGNTPKKIRLYFKHNDANSKIYGIVGNQRITKKGTFWCGGETKVKKNALLYRRRWFDFRI